MKKNTFLTLSLLICTFLVQAQTLWNAQKANEWYAKQPFLFGPNYNPANAINQLEMFQADTFDPATIDRELGWAEDMGINTARVFLQDLLWQQDAEGFKKRLDTFLNICQKHKIRPMLVLFDSCWDPFPVAGKQREPRPGVHNSGWVQSPGAAALTDISQYERLKDYVQGVVGAFANDNRILAWDVWNEPDNTNTNSYGQLEPTNKAQIITRLLPQVFAWARSAKPTQPLTSGVWQPWVNDWSDAKKWSAIEKVQLEQSDIISFHHYGDVAMFEKLCNNLQKLGKPVICTEFLARGVKSDFKTHLPVAKKMKVGMMNWGFVVGKTQTNLPWDSWQKPYINGKQPDIFHHEILLDNGRAIYPEEIDVIKGVMKK
jgi:Cellulase (glycosyl hydrolase family 5)